MSVAYDVVALHGAPSWYKAQPGHTAATSLQKTSRRLPGRRHARDGCHGRARRRTRTIIYDSSWVVPLRCDRKARGRFPRAPKKQRQSGFFILRYTIHISCDAIAELFDVIAILHCVCKRVQTGTQEPTQSNQEVCGRRSCCSHLYAQGLG